MDELVKLMPLKTLAYLPAHGVQPDSDLESLQYKDGILTIVLACSLDQHENIHGISLTFQDVAGFRLLDEVDLARYWPSSGFVEGSHLLEVIDGGWSAEQNMVQGSESRRREWLAVTGNACVSVFCISEPAVSHGSWTRQVD